MEPLSRIGSLPRARRSRLLAFPGALISLALAAGPAVAQASDAWTQFQGNPAHTGSLDVGVQAPFKEIWHADVPAGGPRDQFGLSAPILAGDVVVTVSPTAVIGFDVGTGSQRWTEPRDYGPSVPPALAVVGGRQVLVYTEGFGAHPPGSSPTQSSSPSSSSSRSTTPPPASKATASPSGSGATASPSGLAGSTAGPFDSHLSAIDLTTLEPLWAPVQLNRVSRTGVTVDGDLAFVADNAGTVYAVDLTSGHIRWTEKVGGYSDISLAAGGGKVYVAAQAGKSTFASLVALNASDGKVAWRYEARGMNLMTAPSIGAEAVLVGVGSLASAAVRSVDRSTGALRWSSPLNTVPVPQRSPAVTATAIFCLDLDGQIYRFDPATGERSWDFALNEQASRTSPVVVGPQVLATTNHGRIAAFDAVSGELVWQNTPAGDRLRDPTPSSNSLILVRGGAHPGLVAYGHDPSGVLVRLRSPTTLDAGRLLLGFAGAALPLAALLVLGGRWLLSRAGPAFPDEDASADEEEEEEAGGEPDAEPDEDAGEPDD